MFPFNSRDINCKTPFGAVPTREEVKITFPVSKNACAKGVFLVVRGERGAEGFSLRLPLCLVGESRGYEIYQGSVTYHRAGIYFYRFEVATDEGFMFIGRDKNGSAIRGDFLPEWQQTVYLKSYHTPNNLKGGVIYHIFPDRFARIEDGTSPRYGIMKPWSEDVTIVGSDGVYHADDFYGGNIKGVISKLGYLEKLGVTAIYLSPIFESSSNHRYDTADYMRIDSLFGTEEEFKNLCETAKKHGISLILDGVFNHTGADSIYFNKFNHYNSLGAYQSKESPYFPWYTFTSFPDEYTCWWGITVVPTIARNAKGFQDMISGEGGVLEKWTKLGVSGWRLDVADELSTDFLERIRSKLKSLGEVTLIGEVWEDATTKESYGEKREYLLGSQLDGIMNYPFRRAILEYVKTAREEDFASAVNDIIENYPKESLDACMTLLGTHDTIRTINELGTETTPYYKNERLKYRLSWEERQMGKKRLLLASAIQYFLPGIPNIYYGDEIGMEGFEDPINRRPMTWDGIDHEILSHYQKLGRLRAEHREAFTSPAIVFSGGKGVITIVRGSLELTANALASTYEIKGISK